MTEQQKKIERLGAKLDPDLRAFLDVLIVPILVRDYIAQHGTGTRVAEFAQGVPQFHSDIELSAERIQR